MSNIKKLSNNEKAVQRAVSALEAGAVLMVHAPRGYYTAGRYTLALGEGGFAVYGYGSAQIPAREFTGSSAAESAAWALVSSCGSTRVRDAAIAASKEARHD
jgi:hypothetical protein